MPLSKRFYRRAGKIFLITLVALYLIIGIGVRVVEWSITGGDEQEILGSNIDATILDYQANGHNMHYVAVGEDSLPTIVFVHGSPGSWDAFSTFLSDTSLIKKAQLISVDRPGFGKSNPGIAEPSIEKQAAAIAPILKKRKNEKPLILVGHSYGGPVIARLAMDYPDMVDGLIMVGGPIDPNIERRKWFNYAAKFPLISFILTRSLRTSNNEMWMLNEELKKMLPLWKEITVPVIIIQGGKDVLVKPVNIEFAQAELINAAVDIQYYPEINHFIPWTHPQIMLGAIHQQLDELTRP